jgi:hypothetical protein
VTALLKASATILQRNRTASLRPGSWNPEERTLDVIWTTGARGARFDWASFQQIDEELATDRQNVRLDRLNGGAPVLNTHDRGSIASQIGVVVPGSARMDRGQGVATLKLSERADLADLTADIAAGIIRNLSVGYIVHSYDVQKRDGHRDLWRAVDWEPIEISFVPVPFDAQAQVRAAPEIHPCTIRTLEIPMPDRNSNPSGAPAPAPAGDSTAPASITILRGLAVEAATAFGWPERDCSNLALDMAERGLSEPDARATVMQIAGEMQRRETGGLRGPRALVDGAVETMLRGSNAATMDNPGFHARAIEDALYARMSGTAPTEAAREFMGMTMVQMAGTMLERGGERSVNRMQPNDILNSAAWNRHAPTRGFVDS